MTLNTTGPISLAGTVLGQSVELELGGNGTTIISLNDTNVRKLGGKTAGRISLSDFYGRSSAVPAATSTYSIAGTFYFTVPSAYNSIEIEAWGSGGGAAAAEGYDGIDGTATVVSGTGLTTMTASGGQHSSSSSTLIGHGGGASGGNISNVSGGDGQPGNPIVGGSSGAGGNAPSGSIPGGQGGASVPVIAGAVKGNPGGGPGGGGGGATITSFGYGASPGAGAGGYSKTVLAYPALTPGTVLTLVVGAGGLGGGQPYNDTGGNGANGEVIINVS